MTEEGGWCLGAARLSTSTCVAQDHVNRVLSWRANMRPRLLISYKVEKVRGNVILFLDYTRSTEMFARGWLALKVS